MSILKLNPAQRLIGI